MKYMLIILYILFGCSLVSSFERDSIICNQYGRSTDRFFHNPILHSGADPWVMDVDKFYYYTQTMGNRIELWKTSDLTKLNTSYHKTIWYPSINSGFFHDIWAPEIHYIKGKWYIYFTADSGDNRTHRIYVLENNSEDPMEGSWKLIGKVSDSTNKWAIDPTVFELNDRWYILWSGWQGNVNGEQDIYIAKLKNPWTIEGNRIRISSPFYPWERHGAIPGDFSSQVFVNEGPEILKKDGKIFLIYSVNGCWTDNYCLGMIELTDTAQVLDSMFWKKFPKPVFYTSVQHHVYAPGHCSFFKSPDQKEDWILYHANSNPGAGCGKERSPRIQPFTWTFDMKPDFGAPVSIDSILQVPTGTQ